MNLKAEMGHYSSVVGNSVHLIAENGRFAGQVVIIGQLDELRQKDVQERLLRTICDAINAAGAEAEVARLTEELERLHALIGKDPTHRHIKRGTLYRHLGTARIQSDEPLADYAEVEIYHGAQGDLWARRKVEFHDGRFADLTHPTGEPK